MYVSLFALQPQPILAFVKFLSEQSAILAQYLATRIPIVVVNSIAQKTD
jgi:hypothetical protein